MSHFENYTCKVNNIEFVKKALQEMGLGFKENVQITDYYGANRQVRLAVLDENGKLIPVGFEEHSADGEYELKCVADWFKTRLTQRSFTNRVAQLHDKYTVIDMCEQKGWSIDYDSIQTNEVGELEIMASSYS